MDTHSNEFVIPVSDLLTGEVYLRNLWLFQIGRSVTDCYVLLGFWGDLDFFGFDFKAKWILDLMGYNADLM